MIPFFRNSDIQLFGNYLPISLLSSISKVSEKIAYAQQMLSITLSLMPKRACCAWSRWPNTYKNRQNQQNTIFCVSWFFKSIWHNWSQQITTFTPQNKLAILDGQIVDPETAAKSKLHKAIKVHGAQTNHLRHLVHDMWENFDKIGMRKYPLKHCKLYRLLEIRIYCNKWKICIVLVRH